MGTDRHENHTLSLGFSRAGGGAPDTAAATVLLREQRPYLLVTRFQGHELLRRKVNSSPGPPTASPSSFALPHLGHGCPYLRVRRQFCLPKVAHAPLCILTREASESGEAPFSSVRSLRRGRVTRASPRRSNHSLYPARLLPTSDGYPEGNFGGNQLPGGSIGLSPLYSGRTIDLHVRTASDLQPSFLGLRPARE
ncbi:uncharacterized protein TNCT_488711 [Trichonephila clavata]|uniref:Uncharacterized protein n=1 Tax=Trichonephila clavata TaxID=2740835 RepID=A0A8X6KWR3_TRICU|nr:uncharacterized protein TNCT_678171 [Trichonephila clavata]GFR04809.1 uncharacterized protein TNCT_488711 [Trichonephila clavata]